MDDIYCCHTYARAKCLLTWNLIKCTSNIYGTFQVNDAVDPLTEYGRIEAERLGKEWIDVRIDHLLSSPFERACDTAKALSEQNKSHPEVDTSELLIERKYGSVVPRLMRLGHKEEAAEVLRGSSGGPINRSHVPAGGGESLEGVALRAETAVRQILSRYGTTVFESAEQFTKKVTSLTPALLPDGIPHVVIVSHNIFLIELYEKLQYWGREYRISDCEYKNTDW
jgi:broad specificity phosphatase PhoE